MTNPGDIRIIPFGEFLDEIIYSTKDEENPYTFLIGAGVSRSAGIPLAPEIVDIVKKLSFFQGRTATLNNVLKNCHDDYTCQYERIFSEYFFPYYQKQKFLGSFIKNGKLNKANFYLAKILAETSISNTAISLNFDDLLYKAVSRLEYNYLVIESLEFLPFKLKFRNILIEGHTSLLYIHGLYTNYFLRNSEKEIADFNEESSVILKNLLSNKGVISVGYSFFAWNDVIKESLENSRKTGYFPFNIYLIIYDKKEVPRFKKLLTNSNILTNVVFVIDENQPLRASYVFETLYKEYLRRNKEYSLIISNSFTYEDYIKQLKGDSFNTHMNIYLEDILLFLKNGNVRILENLLTELTTYFNANIYPCSSFLHLENIIKAIMSDRNLENIEPMIMTQLDQLSHIMSNIQKKDNLNHFNEKQFRVIMVIYASLLAYLAKMYNNCNINKQEIKKRLKLLDYYIIQFEKYLRDILFHKSKLPHNTKQTFKIITLKMCVFVYLFNLIFYRMLKFMNFEKEGLKRIINSQKELRFIYSRKFFLKLISFAPNFLDYMIKLYLLSKRLEWHSNELFLEKKFL